MTDSSDLSPEFLNSLQDQKADWDQYDSSMSESFKNTAPNKADARSIQKLLDLVAQVEAMEREAGTAKWFDPSGPYPIPSLPKHEAFFAAGSTYPERLFMAGNRVGKALRISEPVLTPKGWVPIGELVLGSEVCTPSGSIASVTGIFDQGVRDLYRVHFNDGTYTDCDLEHRWKCKGPDERFRKTYTKDTRTWDNPTYQRWQVKSLKEIIDHVGLVPKASRRYSIPVVESLCFSERKHLIDPYTLGVLLGDGSIKTSCAVWSDDPEIVDQLEWIPDRVEIKQGTSCKGYFFTGKLPILKEAGIYGLDSHTKFIPDSYKNSNDRLALLQGLMDTDGYTSGTQSEFVSVSKQLAQDVADIARSLGIRCTIKEKKTSCDYKNKKIKGVAYRVSLWTTSVPLFRLKRKADKQFLGQKKNGAENVIISIEPIGKDFARCIEVNSPDHTFVISNYIVTHNSIAGCYELACHLTGEYPIWWTGHRFDHPIYAWAVGKDARSVRDTAQRELLGGIGEWGTGMIPAHRLGKFFGLQGTPQAIDIIKIKHKSGGWSELGFKNYQQDIGSFMGTSRHVVWADEECPIEIYNECNVRCATVGGIMLVTFTPLDGLTPMVVNFCKRADFLMGAKPVVAMDAEEESEEWQDAEHSVGRETAKAVVQAGWDDAPWLTKQMKARLLDDTPDYLKDARKFGTPAMGAGNVYPYPLESILIDPIKIPDNWPRMYALDVGWNRTAAIWAALDPVSDTLYFYDEHYRGKEIPAVHAYAILSRGKWIPGVIDPASRGMSPTDGQKLMKMYKDLGLTLWPAKNEVESGVMGLSQRFQAGKAKVFKTLVNFQKEYLLYRRDKNGKIVKDNDHLLDAARYIHNNTNRMASEAESNKTKGINYVPTRYRI